MNNFEFAMDVKEQLEIKSELQCIDNYLNYLNTIGSQNDQIQHFIVDIVDKYRYKPEVSDFYNNNDGDAIYGSQKNTLLVLRNMVSTYASRKFGEEILNNLML